MVFIAITVRFWHDTKMKKRPLTLLHALTMTLLLPCAAQAERYSFSTGTGFYVSYSGYIITNAHVVRNCKDKRVFIQQSTPDPQEVELVTISQTHDLALLKTELNPPSIGYLRSDYSAPERGEKVMLLGFPEEFAATGQYDVAYSRILSTKGPNGEPDWMLIEPSARKGNSGGPLLDESGNVIGVITAKLQFFQTNEINNQRGLMGASDAAIKLSALEEFLQENHVLAQYRDQSMILSDGRNQQASSDFIVNVLCQQEVDAQSETAPDSPIISDLKSYYRPN
jgi:S1-C subfamily serine protease